VGEFIKKTKILTPQFRRVHSILILLTVGYVSLACSGIKAESHLENTEESEESEESGHSIPESAQKNSTMTQLSECKSDQGWIKRSNKLKLCRFPTVIYQCKSPLGRENMGAQVKWAILKAPEKTSKQKSNDKGWLKSLHVLWAGVIASEEIPNAHAERIYSQTKLIPTKTPLTKDQDCRSFLAIREQRARSFNQVDARESEFDESSTDEVTFEYDQQAAQYIEVAHEDELEIKVRSR
jgi:hypothetical protein